jgi:HlyD family secretion protein
MGAAAAGSSTAVPATAPGGSVVSYATIVAVSNPDEKLRPGMTATVTLDGSRREHAVRIPNSALSFRPPPAVLRAVGQSTDFQMAPPKASDATGRYVWQFDGVRFLRIAVVVGLADGQWTELVSGPLDVDDTLVTSAALTAGTER